MWYAAHAVMVVRFKDQEQVEFPVWENVLLIDGKTEEDAYRKAEERARSDEGDAGGTFEWEGHPARWEFKTIRRLVECALSSSDAKLQDGAEITYFEFLLPNAQALDCFCRGHEVDITISV